MGIFLAEDGQFLENTIYFLSLNVIMSHYFGTCCLDSVACASPSASSLSHMNAWPLMVVCSWDILVSSSPFPTPPLSLSLKTIIYLHYWYSITESAPSERWQNGTFIILLLNTHTFFLWRVWTFVLLVRFYLKQVSYTSVLEYGRNHISPKV